MPLTEADYDHLRRLEAVLTQARQTYDTFAYIVLEGSAALTLHSPHRSLDLTLTGATPGGINSELEAMLTGRIQELEQEVEEVRAELEAERARESAAVPPGVGENQGQPLLRLSEQPAPAARPAA